MARRRSNPAQMSKTTNKSPKTKRGKKVFARIPYFRMGRNIYFVTVLGIKKTNVSVYSNKFITLRLFKTYIMKGLIA